MPPRSDNEAYEDVKYESNSPAKFAKWFCLLLFVVFFLIIFFMLIYVLARVDFTEKRIGNLHGDADRDEKDTKLDSVLKKLEELEEKVERLDAKVGVGSIRRSNHTRTVFELVEENRNNVIGIVADVKATRDKVGSYSSNASSSVFQVLEDRTTKIVGDVDAVSKKIGTPPQVGGSNVFNDVFSGIQRNAQRGAQPNSQTCGGLAPDPNNTSASSEKAGSEFSKAFQPGSKSCQAGQTLAQCLANNGEIYESLSVSNVAISLNFNYNQARELCAITFTVNQAARAPKVFHIEYADFPASNANVKWYRILSVSKSDWTDGETLSRGFPVGRSFGPHIYWRILVDSFSGVLSLFDVKLYDASSQFVVPVNVV